MARAVNSNDGYLEALVKNMPSETVAGYLAALGMVSAVQGGGPKWMLWLVWGCFLVATPFYLYFMKPSTETAPRPWYQVWIFSPIAFFVWSMSAGGVWASVQVAPLVGGVGVIILSGLIFPLVSMAVAKTSH